MNESHIELSKAEVVKAIISNAAPWNGEGYRVVGIDANGIAQIDTVREDFDRINYKQILPPELFAETPGTNPILFRSIAKEQLVCEGRVRDTPIWDRSYTENKMIDERVGVIIEKFVAATTYPDIVESGIDRYIISWKED